ncbi:MAG: prephenate dehydrogenase [Acidimicrobiia bacterium]
MTRAAILGTGLIGSSVGLGLREAGWRVVGWDPRPEAARLAESRGAIDELAPDRHAALLAAELVLLAAPPAAVIATLAELRTEALVTDVAGVKRPVVAAGAHLPRFVGGHPMAGRESSGPGEASPSLFRGAAWVLVTDGAAEEDLLAVEAMVAALGAHTVRMTADEHDGAVALISQLPQVLAAALLRRAADQRRALELAGGSFADLTRVASSDPSWWTEALVANRDLLAPELRSFAQQLGAWAEAIEEGRAGWVREALVEARGLRGAVR